MNERRNQMKILEHKRTNITQEFKAIRPLNSDIRNRRFNWIIRLLLMTAVALLHSVCYYYLVKSINSQISPSAYWNFHTILDSWIPYLGWTWVFYYLGDIYILFFAVFIVVKLPEKKFYRAVKAYIGMIIMGALIQIALPAESPLPEKLTNVQQWFHDSLSLNLYACLPSMHVALTVLPACLSLSVLKSNWLRMISVLIAIFITISTVTLKEHYFLDSLAGVMFALLFYGLWRWEFKKILKKR